jgi:hypothetical protein
MPIGLFPSAGPLTEHNVTKAEPLPGIEAQQGPRYTAATVAVLD